MAMVTYMTSDAIIQASNNIIQLTVTQVNSFNGKVYRLLLEFIKIPKQTRENKTLLFNTEKLKTFLHRTEIHTLKVLFINCKNYYKILPHTEGLQNDCYKHSALKSSLSHTEKNILCLYFENNTLLCFQISALLCNTK